MFNDEKNTEYLRRIAIAVEAIARKLDPDFKTETEARAAAEKKAQQAQARRPK